MKPAATVCFLAMLGFAAALASAAEEKSLEERVAALERAAAGKPFKFGTVSEAEVLDNLEEKKDIDADIELGEKKALDILIPMRKECERLNTEIKMLGEGSQDRKAKTAELEQKKNELTQKYETLRNNLQEEARKRLNEIRAKIRSNVAAYARKHGYTMVIERNALLFCEEGKDLTTAIIDQMNTEYFKARYEDEEEAGDDDVTEESE